MAIDGAERKRRLSGHYVLIPDSLLDSLAWRSLPHSAHSLYLFVRRHYYGKNNGNLSITFTQVKAAGLFRSRDAFYRARDALWERGFITMTREGDWGSERTCHLWALTTDEIDANPRLGIAEGPRTDCWKPWAPDKSSPNFQRYAPLIQKKRAEASRRARRRAAKSCVRILDRFAS